MKKTFKKLHLSKKTISNLNVIDMEKHAGGAPTNGQGHTCTKCQTVNGTYCTFYCTYTCTQTFCGGSGCNQ